MDKHSILEKLRAHEPELKAAGIVHLRLFGSVARGENGPESDVDLMAEFDRGKRLSLLGMIGLEHTIGDLLGVPVDLSEERSLKKHVAENALREAELAF
jgi:predicted nucleotidyltransferase